MKNEKGLSLVELIVAIAIMAIVLGASVAGIGSLTSQKINAASKRIYNMLGSTQTVAMSKGNTLFAIIMVDKHPMVYTLYKEYKDTAYRIVKSEELSNTIQVYFETKDGNKYTIGSEASSESSTCVDGLIISIDRNTGAFTGTYTYNYSGNFQEMVPTTIGSKLASDCSRIGIIRANRNASIVLVPLTGKFYYD